MTTKNDSCYRFVVSGRVQGVFYRDTTRNKATNLGLRGWVRNLRSGDVELVAGGPREKIRLLEDWLWKGPELARVTRVVAEEIELADIPTHGFDIIRTA
jgi:acylphosphatase